MEIKNIRLKDGTPCGSVLDAVEKFKCPGPCDPDCPLNPTVRLDGGGYGHMCHPGYACSHPVKVLDAMLCSYETAVGDQSGTGQLYAAVIRSGAVRDAQVCSAADTDPMSENWDDVPSAEIWLGFFRDPDALHKAAEFGCTVPENIRLIPVDGAGRGDTPPAYPPAKEIVLEDAGGAGADCRNYTVKIPRGATLRGFIEMIRQERKDESGKIYVSGNLAEASAANSIGVWEYENGTPVAEPDMQAAGIDGIKDRKIRTIRASGGWGRMAWYLSLEPGPEKEAADG